MRLEPKEDEFPILRSRLNDPLEVVPFSLVMRHARQCQTNHYQSVGRLKERGGLSWCELCAVLQDRPWRKMHTDEDPKAQVLAIVKEWQK